MLWLAGLMGIAGVGAASLITFPPDDEPEEDTPMADDIIQTGHDLLDEIDAQYPTSAAQPDIFELVAEDIQAELGTTEMPDTLAPVETLLTAIEDEVFETESEEVLVGDWVSQGEPSEVISYRAETESLMLVWDDMATSAKEPDVDVAPDPDDEDVMHVLMNDRSVAEVYGDPDLTAADVTLIPLSSALIVGLEPSMETA